MSVFDLNVGTPCDHKAIEVLSLVHEVNDQYRAVLKFKPLQEDLTQGFKLYRNGVEELGVSIVVDPSSAYTVRFNPLLNAIDHYPYDDFTLEFTVATASCPKCKGGIEV